MVVNLQDVDSTRLAQPGAAQQEQSQDTEAQSALVGTLVSSLHRLKDVDNTGGYVSLSSWHFWYL